MLHYLVYKIGEFFVKIFPLRWSYRFAEFFSDLHFRFSKIDRTAVENNLKTILKTETVDPALVRDVFRNFGRYLAEFFRYAGKINEDFLANRVELRNFERIDDVLEKGKGGILLSSHIGNWELGGMLIPALGHSILVVALPHRNRRVNILFNSRREISGVRVVANSVAFRRCLETLRSRQLLAIVGDRDFSNNGVPMDFLGKRAMIPKGPAILSIKTGAPIIPAICIRMPDSKFLFEIGEPIMPPEADRKDLIDESQVEAMMEQCKTRFEENIRRYPTQWLMFREFWIK